MHEQPAMRLYCEYAQPKYNYTCMVIIMSIKSHVQITGSINLSLNYNFCFKFQNETPYDSVPGSMAAWVPS
jgi:hypothetical protein